jgi:hypothetical protein
MIPLFKESPARGFRCQGMSGAGEQAEASSLFGPSSAWIWKACWTGWSGWMGRPTGPFSCWPCLWIQCLPVPWLNTCWFGKVRLDCGNCCWRVLRALAWGRHLLLAGFQLCFARLCHFLTSILRIIYSHSGVRVHNKPSFETGNPGMGLCTAVGTFQISHSWTLLH